MKFFVPAVGYRIKLTQDWSFKLYGEYRNKTAFEFLGKDFDANHGWRNDELKSVDASLPSGTLLEVDRVYVRTANKARSGDDDFDSITFKLVDSKKKVRFWAKLMDVNTIEYELPPNHEEGKTKAQDRAKQPKKLDPSKIRNIVYAAMQSYKHGNKDNYYGKAPSWMTVDLVKQFDAVRDEHTRLREPYERAKFDAASTKRRAELELGLAMGSLSLPIGLADKVKTVDDLKKYGLYHGWGMQEFEYRCHDWDYVINYVVMGRSGYQSKKSYEQLPDGTRCRMFRPTEMTWEKDAPNMQHLWLKVYTDKDDLEVVRVEAGFDSPEKPTS